MTTVTSSPSLMSTEELLALPEDGVDRDLIRRQLRERPKSRRNRRHSRTESNVVAVLKKWSLSQPKPHGEVLSGEAGFRIRRNPDTTVGIDVAYISAELARQTPEDAALVDGAPMLAVEILSPSDTQDDILEKVRDYLDAGVGLVWVVEPVFRTVDVYRPDAPPLRFNATQRLNGEPHLPGFDCPVSEIFGA